jgi:methylated-DNA-[protein]-cysteine S-methyltransferase
VETAVYQSPFGPIKISVCDGKLARVELSPSGGRPGAAPARSALPYVRALERYFAGADPGVEWEAMDLSDCTAFQRRVLRKLTAVPFGGLVTYGELAGRVRLRSGARAVGGAVGSNPLPIFIPCHRVVAAGGGLGGFSGGLGWKERLLTHEGRSVKEGKVR